LQDFEFELVGGNKTFRVDCRVVLATNDDLSQAVAEGRFRQDLFYRINVINIELPSLRDRISDIPMLAEHFLTAVVEDSGKPVRGFSEEALQILRRYHWPGNVRELQNIVERAVLLGKGDIVQPDDLPNQLQLSSVMNFTASSGQRLKDALGAPERQIILETLQENNWNRNATAAALGINRTTLYKKMKKLGLHDPRHIAEPARS
jgi:DNA-binding NtrC family response regulator